MTNTAKNSPKNLTVKNQTKPCRLFNQLWLIVLLALLAPICCRNGVVAADLFLDASSIGFPNPSMSPATVVEFSYSINADGLTFLPDTTHNGYIAGVAATLILFDSQNLPIDTVAQAFATRSSIESDSSMFIGNRLRMIIQPGKYSAELTVMDVTSKATVSRYFRISLDSAMSKSLLISGLELAYDLAHVGVDSTGDPLIKNGWRVFPNPAAAFSTNDSLINVYAEVYNLQPDEQGKYHIGARVELLSRGEEVPAILSEVFWEVQGSSIVYTRSLHHAVTETGKQLLSLIITDPASGITDTSSRELYFRNPYQLVATASSGQNSYDTTSLKTRTEMVYWLLTPRQREFLSSLTEAGQQQYIAQFWMDNGDNPELGFTPFRDDIMKRYSYANDKYSFTSEIRDGWFRDPGRVLFQYGFPDEVIDVAIPAIENDITSGSSWERWNYDRIQGGVYFIFADEYGYSEFRLKHSNAQGETFDSGIERNINQLFRQSGG
jgi:GWxTD domain-containing protein